MNLERYSAVQWLTAILLCTVVGTVCAEVPLASPEDDRRAKQAAPTIGRALLYVYRKRDESEVAATVALNGRDVARLEPQTFGLWNIEPGRTEIRADDKVLALQCEAGRIYFVEVARTLVGGLSVRQVSYSLGRTQTHQARLVSSASGAGEVSPARNAWQPAPAPGKNSVSKGVRGERFALGIKVASFSLVNNPQSILGAKRTFNNTVSSLSAFEGEYFVNENVSVGGQYLRYSSDFATSGSSTAGKMDVTVVLVNAKYYFGATADRWRPYVGAGLGGATTDFSGPIAGNTGGTAFQGLVGLEWRYRALGLRADYEYVGANTKDASGQNVDVSGSGFFLGAGVHF